MTDPVAPPTIGNSSRLTAGVDQANPMDLVESERSMRQILDAIPHIAWATAPDGDVVYMNARWCEYTGIDVTDNASIRSAIHPEDLPAVIESMTRSRATGVFHSYDLRLRGSDGDYRWHRVRSTALRDSDGRPRLWIGTSTDVHDEVLVAEALRESEDHYRFLVDSNPQVPWIADADGKLTDCSEGWLVMTGLTREEALNGGWTDVPHPDDLPFMPDAWMRSMQHGEILDVEHRARMADGTYRWMRTRTVPRKDAAGNIIKWYGTTEDVHERRATEEALKLLNDELEHRVEERTAELAQINRKLQEAYREAESFSYTASHDLRAPLRAVISTSKLLAADYGAHLPEEARNLLDDQVAAAKRLANLIDALLAYSRIGKQDVRREKLDLTSMATSVASELGPMNPLTKIEIQSGLKGFGDPLLVRVVFQNLIENALLYSPAGGTIRVGQDLSQKGTPLFVSDEGIGFEMEYANRVFEPFQRLHRDGEYAGTGIGLANVKRIVERHEGAIWVESAVGSGSTFYFTLDGQQM